MWLGPAPKRPFNPRRFHSSWRWFFDYGTGDVGNDGVHRMDYGRWAMNTAMEAQGEKPVTLPSRISVYGGKWYFDDAQEWPDTLQALYQYDAKDGRPGKLFSYEMRLWTPYNTRGRGYSEGALVYGDKGYILIHNRQWKVFENRDRLVAEGALNADSTHFHVRNFLECVKTRNKPNADLETVGHPSSVLCHTANVAWRVGREVHFDPQTEMFIDDFEANAFRTRPEYRKPWVLPEV